MEFIEKEYQGVDVSSNYEKAIIKFAENSITNTDIKHGFAIAAIQSLYQKMLSAGDYPGALAAIKEFNKINNLYEVPRKRKPQEKQDASGGLIDTLRIDC